MLDIIWATLACLCSLQSVRSCLHPFVVYFCALHISAHHYNTKTIKKYNFIFKAYEEKCRVMRRYDDWNTYYKSTLITICCSKYWLPQYPIFGDLVFELKVIWTYAIQRLETKVLYLWLFVRCAQRLMPSIDSLVNCSYSNTLM